MKTVSNTQPFNLANIRRVWAIASIHLSVVFLSHPAVADDDAPYDKDGIPTNSIAKSLPQNGDPYGARKQLSEQGINFGVNYIGEVWSNRSGGLKLGTAANGRAELVIDADLEKISGQKDLTFHANAFQIHGGTISKDYTGGLLGVTNIEANPSTRLSELWVEQKVGKVSVRVGQIAADTEFITSAFAGVFVGSTFGWPAITAADLPGGGPAYPFATPGVRVKYDINDNLTALVGVFNGDPAGKNGDPQRLNRTGTNFRLNDPPFVIAEGQYKLNQGKKETGLATTLKFGGWAHFGSFDDLRFDRNGDSLVITGARAARISGNQGVYAVIDQQFYRPAGVAADKGIASFLRVSASPGDQNLIDFYADGGFTFSSIIPERADDTLGVGLAYGRISDRARGADRDAIQLGNPQPVRDYEMALEITYQAKLADGWVIQPDFQYIWHPGGNVANPRDVNGATSIKDAAVIGVRSVINY